LRSTLLLLPPISEARRDSRAAKKYKVDKNGQGIDKTQSTTTAAFAVATTIANTVAKSLYRHAFDTLAIPAMSAECERVFNSTKKLVIPERNRLAEEIIEASEYLKN
jgi:hypothetical protein